MTAGVHVCVYIYIYIHTHTTRIYIYIHAFRSVHFFGTETRLDVCMYEDNPYRCALTILDVMSETPSDDARCCSRVRMYIYIYIYIF